MVSQLFRVIRSSDHSAGHNNCRAIGGHFTSGCQHCSLIMFPKLLKTSYTLLNSSESGFMKRDEKHQSTLVEISGGKNGAILGSTFYLQAPLNKKEIHSLGFKSSIAAIIRACQWFL